MTKSETAVSIHQQGYNCAQGVVLAFAEELGLARETALGLAAGLGGGMRMGEVCGAVSGALVMLGVKYGFTLETKGDLYRLVKEFNRRFKAENHTVVCRELLGYDFSKDGEQAAAIQSGRTQEVCPRVVASAVEILEAIFAAYETPGAFTPE